ncbi:MAG: polyribonucleotide nucleotidyltransferase [bacterium]
MNNKTFKIKIGEKELIIEIKDLAEQASGSCFVRYGDTLVLATAVMSKEDKADQGFFPLTVEYEERYYAGGKIKGPRYTRREGKPSDEAIVNARLIDRAIRPLFPKNLNREVQVVVTVLSWDGQNDPDILGLTAASTALLISDIPWLGPVSSVRAGKNGEHFSANPTYEEREKNKVDIVFAATENEKKELLINMIEAKFEEVEEGLISQAYQFAKNELKDLIDFQKKIAAEAGKEKLVLPEALPDPELEKEIKDFLADKLEKAIFVKGKTGAAEQLKNDLICYVQKKYPAGRSEEDKSSSLPFATARVFDEEIDKIVHEKAIKEEKRPDGRKIDEVRELDGEVGLIPHTHGSGLFARGQTKSLSILTLGAPGDQQLLEGMEITGKKRFMHHYNFPPYSAGEIKPMRGPGRREIGHGMLAEKAILPVIPSFEEFPYTIRIVSEILSSNGSTSQAAITSSCLALMDAGVPIKAPVTGIALGLMQDDQGNYKILTDIQGPEDHHGDMDFKVAGTKNGVTALQMDVKITGITEKIFQEALERGKKARTQILETINKIIGSPRPELSPFAPRIIMMQINPDKIREVIGPGGKIINEIIAECGVAIDIDDSGKIFITSEKKETAEKAASWIKDITREVAVGEIFEGKVKRILTFGAFVEILPGQEGLIHISKLANYRVAKVEDVVNIGDLVSVKVISVDDQGRINLALNEKK